MHEITNTDIQINVSYPDYFQEDMLKPSEKTDCMTGRILTRNGVYSCPIVQLRGESQTGDETSAVTIFMKRNVNVETQRDLTNYTTLIGADEHYVAALTDESKVVVAKFAVGDISL